MDENKVFQLLSHFWELIAGALSAAVSYMFYRRRKDRETQEEILKDNLTFKIEIREMKEDIKDIKDWLFTHNNKKK